MPETEKPFEVIAAAVPPKDGIKHPFEYQRPNERHIKNIGMVRDYCKLLHTVLVDLRDEGEMAPREAALAITMLETVSMWANKGIVLSDPAKR